MKLVYFGNDSDFSKTIFFHILQQVKTKDIEIVFVINTEIRRKALIKRLFFCIVKKVFNLFDKCTTSLTFRYFDDYIGEITYLNTNKDNSPYFVALIKELKADYAIVAGCGVIFEQKLINTFKYGVVNYHNSLLPEYKGLGGESMPFYHNKKELGYTFHFMNENIDEGNIILQNKMSICAHKSIYWHHEFLLSTLDKGVEKLLNKLLSLDKGYSQKKLDSYYGKKEIAALQVVDSLDSYSYVELTNLIKCFGSFLYEGKKVTKITKNKRIKRINYLPAIFYGYI